MVTADAVPEAEDAASASAKGGGKSGKSHTSRRSTTASAKPKSKANTPVMLSTSYTCWRKVPDTLANISQALPSSSIGPCCCQCYIASVRTALLT